jgi:hypothetical protein
LLLLVLHWCLVRHMWLLLLVCVLAGACGFDFRSAFVDYGLVFCVGGGVATVECVVECSTEGFSRAVDTCCRRFEVCHCALLVQIMTRSVWDRTVWVVVWVGIDAGL